MTRFRQEVEYFSSRGYPVTVVHSPYRTEKSARRRTINYVEIRHIRHSILMFQVRLFLKCLKYYLSTQRSTFIAHNPISSIPPALLCLVGLHPRIVLVMHGPSAVETYLRGNKPKAAFQSIIDRIALALAGKIVAVSEYERSYAIRLKANPGKITIIRNGIELPKLTKHSAFRQELRIPQDRITIGYIGSAVAYRGIEFLLEGFSIACTMTKIPIALVLVFSEELSTEQRNRMKEMAGPHCNSVYISRPRIDVTPVLSTLDVYASHFSRKIDGIGFSVMEAMASTLPVITGRDNITNRLLRDGIEAILVEKESPEQIAAAIKKVVEDPLLRRKLGKNARKTVVERFSKQHMLALCEREYLNVVPR